MVPADQLFSDKCLDLESSTRKHVTYSLYILFKIVVPEFEKYGDLKFRK